MKKILLCLMLTICANHLTAQQLPTLLTLTQKESEFLAYLNDSYIEDNLFYKKLSNADLALSLDILSRKIQLLNKEALPENSWQKKPGFIFAGLVPLSVAICFTIIPSQALYELYTQFKSGKFGDIHLPISLIEKLPAKTISREEKRYLKRFSFEKQYFDYIEDPFAYEWVINPKTGWMHRISQEQIIEDKIANLSPTEREKIKYLALRSAITDLKLEALRNTCLVLAVLTIGAFCSIAFFYEAFMYEVKIQEEIKLNKKLYNLLQKEQESDRLFLW